MTFQERLKRDLEKVFLNTNEFAEKRTIQYEDQCFEDIPVVLSSLHWSGLHQASASDRPGDHVQGLFQDSVTLYCSKEDFGNLQPEQGALVQIRNANDSFESYYVLSSTCELDLFLSIELRRVTGR